MGLGGIGRSLLEIATKDKNDVVVIEEAENKCKEIARGFDVLTIVGDATEKEILEEAGADRATTLIATTSDDAANLMMCIAAKEMGAKKVVAVVNQEEHAEMFKKAGISLLENPDMIVAKHLYYSAKRPCIRDFFSINNGKAEIFTVVVQEKARVVGKALSELRMKEGVVIVIERDKEIILPKNATTIRAGDAITIFAKAKDVDSIASIFS